MLASEAERERIAQEVVGGAIVLDGIGHKDRYMAEQAEELLEYSDWMAIPIEPYPITLDRLKSLLSEQAASF